MPDTAIFDLRDICKCHTLPTGRQSIATSAMILKTELPMKNALWLMQFSGGIIAGSQKPRMGLQLNIAVIRTANPQAPTKAPTI